MDQSKISLAEAQRVLRLRLKREAGAEQQQIDREQLKNMLGVDDETLNGLLESAAQTDRFGFDRSARLSLGLAAATAFAIFSLLGGGMRITSNFDNRPTRVSEARGSEVHVIALGPEGMPLEVIAPAEAPRPPEPATSHETFAEVDVALAEAEVARAEAEARRAIAESAAAEAAIAGVEAARERSVIKTSISRDKAVITVRSL